MDKETILWRSQIMAAYANGDDIESKRKISPKDSIGETWSDDENPLFDWLNYDYRIKPKENYRLFESAEECLAEAKKHEPFGVITNDGGKSYYQIAHYDNDRIYYYSHSKIESATYKDCVHFQFADGKPFELKIVDGEIDAKNDVISIYCNDRKSYSLEDFKLKKDELHLEPIGIHIKTDIVNCIMGLDEWEGPWCKATNCDKLIGPKLTESQALQITSGYDSTKAVVDKLPEGSAAKMCWDYNKDGLQWYLPCLNELCAMSAYIDEINDLLSHFQELGYKASPIKNAYYWSSSEYSKTYAWTVYTYDGDVYPWYDKNLALVVRPFLRA